MYCISMVYGNKYMPVNCVPISVLLKPLDYSSRLLIQ